MRQPSAWHVALSRRLNGWRGGDPDVMLCAALHRSGSWCCPVIDAAMFVLRRGERGHCRAMSDYEGWRHASPVDRLRRKGW